MNRMSRRRVGVVNLGAIVILGAAMCWTTQVITARPLLAAAWALWGAALAGRSPGHAPGLTPVGAPRAPGSSLATHLWLELNKTGLLGVSRTVLKAVFQAACLVVRCFSSTSLCVLCPRAEWSRFWSCVPGSTWEAVSRMALLLVRYTI